MKSLGKNPVWLTGSRKTVRRTVRTDGAKFYITWYGQVVEVKDSGNGYVTVDKY